MGRWSQDIVGGDTALDILGEIGDDIHVKNLHNLDLTKRVAAKARIALENMPETYYASLVDRYEDEGSIVYGALLLHVGAKIPEKIKADIIVGIDNNLANYKTYLSKNDPLAVRDREAALLPLRKAILEAAPGQRYRIKSTGLFEKISNTLNGVDGEQEVSVAPM